MPGVLDASIILEWCLGEANFTVAERVLGSVAGDAWVVPSLWPFEVANGIRSAARRGLTDDYLAQTMRLVLSLPVVVEPALPSKALSLVSLALRHNLTVYDAAYLQLAMERHLPLATFDGALSTASSAEGVVLLASR